MKKSILLSVLAALCLFFPARAQPKGPGSYTITGTVNNAQGDALPGASLQIDNGIKHLSDEKGNFRITIQPGNKTLTVSYVGYQKAVLALPKAEKQGMVIVLRTAANDLEEIQVIPYGTVTKRLNTGNVTTIKGADLARQPVSNPLAAMQGRVPGLQITQSSGVNGAGFKVQIRGQASLLQGSDPLFIIDGVPYANDNTSLNQLRSAAGSGSTSTTGMSPFNLINSADIESVEVLKDADATAIYGSRGANGVILITTKKGKAGPVRVQLSAYSGASKVTRTMDMLNSAQYVQMRKEAFRNDGVIPTVTNAPELLLWDTTRYTDFKKLLIGGTARSTDGQLSVSGGGNGTQFNIGGGFHRETTVYPTKFGDSRGNVRVNVNHQSPDRKLDLSFTSTYATDRNRLPASDLNSYINTTPMLKLYGDDGKLNWQEGGATYQSLLMNEANPLAFQNRAYTGKYQNLNSSLQFSYGIVKGLKLTASLGYNQVTSDETSLFPSTSLDPFSGQLPNSSFATRNQKSWIIEPRVSYILQSGKSAWDFLMGGTWQDKTGSGYIINAGNYNNDLLLGSIAAAGTTQSSNTFGQYRYQGFYGRINYNLAGKYIINLSGRRDGSSRFGADRRFSNFGAAGAAWLFGEEDWVRNSLPFLSFGKLRASFGITGNDQIGDYRYIDTWAPNATTYQNVSVLNPSALFNPAFSWERNRKTELALEIGALKNRVLFTGTYYSNRSDNQLVSYTLPGQTGFNDVLTNLDAAIRNYGWEFQLSSQNISSGPVQWRSSFNMTVPRNKLLSFPGLATSTYANTFITGESVTTRRIYNYLGVDPQTGIYKIQDVNGDGIYNSQDRTALAKTDARFYGGFQNSVTWNGWELDVLFEYKKQTGRNYLENLTGTIPGYWYYNQPEIVLSRWQKPGDITDIQRFTATSDEAILAANVYMRGSTAIYSDASYLRCKTAGLTYTFDGRLARKLRMQNIRLYVQGQNLFTITGYRGADPENQGIYRMPPLRTLVAGFQVTL